MNEKNGFSVNGFVAAPVLALLTFGAVRSISIPFQVADLLLILLTATLVLCWAGFFMVQPKQARVLTMFGSYMGTVKETGLRWTIPFFIRRNISLRIRNFESGKLKVNDNQGNPIEIATVVVWSVEDSAKAVFEVDDYESYVSIQSEAALRNLATSYPYDIYEKDEVALRSHPQIISDALSTEFPVLKSSIILPCNASSCS